MRKIILLFTPLILTACIQSSLNETKIPEGTKQEEVATTDSNAPKEEQMIIQKSSPETEKKDIQPIKKTEPDEKTDEIAKELDSIIDDLISGK